jgi:hypothetical protein
MDSLTELYNSHIVPLDQELEKQAAEMVKQAEEEDAAGRIMARGFADELNKLAQGPYGPDMGSALGGRKARAPSMPDISEGKGQFGKGSVVKPSGEIKPPPAQKPPGGVGAAPGGAAPGGAQARAPKPPKVPGA